GTSNQLATRSWPAIIKQPAMPRPRDLERTVHMANDTVSVLIIGAHPDDADIKAGGSAAKWCDLGHIVRLVSLTNGQAGHQSMPGTGLARRRRAEAEASAATIGATYEVLECPDGELDDRLEY